MTPQAAIKMPAAFLDQDGDQDNVLSLKAAMREDVTALMTPDRVNIITRQEVIRSCQNIATAFRMGQYPGAVLGETAVGVLLPFLEGEEPEQQALREQVLETICVWGQLNEPDKGYNTIGKFATALEPYILEPEQTRPAAKMLINTMVLKSRIGAELPLDFLLNRTDLFTPDKDHEKNALKLNTVDIFCDRNDGRPMDARGNAATIINTRCAAEIAAYQEHPLSDQAALHLQNAAFYTQVVRTLRNLDLD